MHRNDAKDESVCTENVVYIYYVLRCSFEEKGIGTLTTVSFMFSLVLLSIRKVRHHTILKHTRFDATTNFEAPGCI